MPHNITIKGSDPRIQQLAKTACEIQDACNLCGIAQHFARDMLTLYSIVREDGGGTAELAQHPIVRAWLSKFVDLSKFSYQTESEGLGKTSDLAEGKDVESEVQ